MLFFCCSSLKSVIYTSSIASSVFYFIQIAWLNSLTGPGKGERRDKTVVAEASSFSSSLYWMLSLLLPSCFLGATFCLCHNKKIPDYFLKIKIRQKLSDWSFSVFLEQQDPTLENLRDSFGLKGVFNEVEMEIQRIPA